MAEREPRQVIAESLGASIGSELLRRQCFADADRILAALRSAGYDPEARYEQVGWQFVDGDGFISRGTPPEGMDPELLPVVPVYRRVEGGATGEQTDSLRVGDHLLTDSELVRRRPSKEDAQ